MPKLKRGLTLTKLVRFTFKSYSYTAPADRLDINSCAILEERRTILESRNSTVLEFQKPIPKMRGTCTLYFYFFTSTIVQL